MAKIQLGKYCCQGGTKIIDTEDFKNEDLVIASCGKRILLFSPLGNRPEEPVLALVGITPGSQSEVFAGLLRSRSVESAASAAAFAKGQDAIKSLLMAHDFATSIGVDLSGDLNQNPKILTTSLVKCCLKVDGSYQYKAPDIVASPEATYCLSNRFVPDMEKYPSLKWIVIFGESGWEAINALRHGGMSIRHYLESKGKVVLNFPHFAQNFQQRAIFMLPPQSESEYFAAKPSHKSYAPTARRMKSELIDAMGRSGAMRAGGYDGIKKPIRGPSHETADPSGSTSKGAKWSAKTDNDLFSYMFYLHHESGDKLYPVRIRNRDTGKLAFRVSKGGSCGNTKEAGMELEDESLMKAFVLEQGYAVRASTLNRSRNGLFKVGQRSIVRAVEAD